MAADEDEESRYISLTTLSIARYAILHVHLHEDYIVAKYSFIIIAEKCT